jgi:glutamate 5-kinase
LAQISQLDVSQLVEIDTAGAGSVGGTGGMSSKVDAAVWAGTHGVTTLIANG